MTAIPCGQKKRIKEMIQSQMVTPPLAAIEGTTLRLKTATTNRSTRSRWPRTRLRCGWDSAVFTSWVNVLLRKVSAESRSEPIPRFAARGGQAQNDGWPQVDATGDAKRLVSSGDRHQAAFGLRLSQTGRDFFKHHEVFVDVRFAVLHGNRP